MDRRTFILTSAAAAAGFSWVLASGRRPGRLSGEARDAAGALRGRRRRRCADARAGRSCAQQAQRRRRRRIQAGRGRDARAGARSPSAEPDGATLGLYSISPFLTVPHLQKVPYDTLKDFTFIAIYAYIPIAFYVKTESPLKDLAGVLKHAKDNPGKLRWGTSGVRGAAHIAVEAAFRKEGVQDHLRALHRRRRGDHRHARQSYRGGDLGRLRAAARGRHGAAAGLDR